MSHMNATPLSNRSPKNNITTNGSAGPSSLDSQQGSLSRRQALRILGFGGAAIGLGSLGWLGSPRVQRVTRSATLMGTRVNLTLMGEDREACIAAAENTLTKMQGIESLLSRHQLDSEVGQLNATGEIANPSPALLDCLRQARLISELGDGGFDVTVQPVVDAQRHNLDEAAFGDALDRVDYRQLEFDASAVRFLKPRMQLTLDGIGKGYIVDRGVDALRQHGFQNVFVEAGGDLLAAGNRGHGNPWRIGIRHPRPSFTVHSSFETMNRAVATSGDYMQAFTADYSQHHIVDPRTGRSSPQLASSTVVASDTATADALATLTMVMDADAGRDLLESLPGCEGFFVTKQLEVIKTSHFGKVDSWSS